MTLIKDAGHRDIQVIYVDLLPYQQLQGIRNHSAIMHLTASVLRWTGTNALRERKGKPIDVLATHATELGKIPKYNDASFEMTYINVSIVRSILQAT